jgi:cation transport ATPase
VFVPTILGTAGITFAAWLAMGFPIEACIPPTVSVLVVACPCALGTSPGYLLFYSEKWKDWRPLLPYKLEQVELTMNNNIDHRTGQAAKRGILVKNAESFEKSGNLDIIAFDKTGTLTEPVPTVTDFVRIEGASESKNTRTLSHSTPAIPYTLVDNIAPELLALERKSEHPLAKSYVKWAEGRDSYPLMQCEEFQSTTGAGVTVSTVKCYRSLRGELLCSHRVDRGLLMGRKWQPALILFFEC